jgi:hypothetical protein
MERASAVWGVKPYTRVWNQCGGSPSPEAVRAAWDGKAAWAASQEAAEEAEARAALRRLFGSLSPTGLAAIGGAAAWKAAAERAAVGEAAAWEGAEWEAAETGAAAAEALAGKEVGWEAAAGEVVGKAAAFEEPGWVGGWSESAPQGGWGVEVLPTASCSGEAWEGGAQATTVAKAVAHAVAEAQAAAAAAVAMKAAAAAPAKIPATRHFRLSPAEAPLYASFRLCALTFRAWRAAAAASAPASRALRFEAHRWLLAVGAWERRLLGRCLAAWAKERVPAFRRLVFRASRFSDARRARGCFVGWRRVQLARSFVRSRCRPPAAAEDGLTSEDELGGVRNDATREGGSWRAWAGGRLARVAEEEAVEAAASGHRAAALARQERRHSAPPLSQSLHRAVPLPCS